MAQRYGGKYSPGGKTNQPPPQPPPQPLSRFRGRRAANVNVFARLAFLAPIPLLFAALGEIMSGDAIGMLVEVSGFGLLMVSAGLLNEGLKAEAAFAARKIARPPAVPRKLLAAALTGVAIFSVHALSNGTGLIGGAIFGIVAAAAHVLAFGLDPLRSKGLAGFDASQTDRVARAIEGAETLLSEMTAAAHRIGDRDIEARVDAMGATAREVFRAVENDPRDLSRARKFLGVYLKGARDATVKFADLYARSRDTGAREDYLALLCDLERSFTNHRADLLADNRTDLDVEIEVLRERLQQEGLRA